LNHQKSSQKRVVAKIGMSGFKGRTLVNRLTWGSLALSSLILGSLLCSGIVHPLISQAQTVPTQPLPTLSSNSQPILIWQQLQRQAGDFQKITQTKLVRASSPAEQDLVMVTIQFARLTDDLILVFDQNKEIAGVDFPTP
jgi:hypothetical protein